MLWIFFLIAIFIMHPKNAFGQNFFQISCTGSKVPFWQNWKISKTAFAWNLKKNLAKSKHLGCQKMSQGPLNMPFEVWCVNIAPKLKNIRNTLWKQGFLTFFTKFVPFGGNISYGNSGCGVFKQGGQN